MKKKVNNCWQTLSKKFLTFFSKKVIWKVCKLALLGIRLICKLINILEGEDIND